MADDSAFMRRLAAGDSESGDGRLGLQRYARVTPRPYSRLHPRAIVAFLRPRPDRVVRAAERLRTSDPAGLLDYVDRAIMRYPRSAELRLMRAIAICGDQPDASLLEAAAALTLGRQDAGLCFRAAALLRDLGYVDEARETLRHVNTIKPPDFVLAADVVSLEGLLAWDSGDDAEAENRLRAALKLAPTNNVAARNLMQFLAGTGRREEALAVVKSGARALAADDWVRELSATIANEDGAATQDS